MGSPGSGKSTVARILAQKLNKPSIDIDNDVLEPMWGVKISEKVGNSVLMVCSPSSVQLKRDIQHQVLFVARLQVFFKNQIKALVL